LSNYAHDFAGEGAQYFRRYQRDRPEPVTIISNTDTEGAQFLNHAHARLVEYHLYENQNASYTGFEAETVFRAADPPEFAVLATWNIGVSFISFFDALSSVAKSHLISTLIDIRRRRRLASLD
jgi:hypothetical protein